MVASATQLRIRIAIITAAALLLIVGLVFQPLAIRLAQAAANERGWTLTVHRVRPGMRGLWFKDLRASRPAVGDFQVALDAVLVPWSKVASRNAFVVVGGTVQLPKRLESLRDDFTATSRASLGARPRKLAIRILGITVHWSAVGSEATAWGISGDLGPELTKLFIDRVEVGRKDAAGLLIGADVGLRREPSGWKLDAVKIAQARFELRTGGESPPSPNPPTVTAGRAGAKSRAPASETVDKSNPTPDVIERLVMLVQTARTHAGYLRQFVAQRLSTQATAEVSNVSLRWSHAKQSLNMGPFQSKSRRDAAGLTLALEQRGEGADQRRFLELQIPLAPSRIEFTSEIGFVSLKDLGVQEADFGLQRVDVAKFRLKVRSTIDELVASASATVNGEVQDLSVLQPWLASRTVTGINAEFNGSAGITWNSGSALRIDELSLRVGRARLDISADIRRTGHETRAKVDLNVPLAACEDLIESLPSGLAPLASEVRLDGHSGSASWHQFRYRASATYGREMGAVKRLPCARGEPAGIP